MTLKNNPNMMWGIKIFDGYRNGIFYTHPLGEGSQQIFEYKLNTQYHTDDPIKLCESGFHYSPTLFEASQYKSILKTFEMRYSYIAPVCNVAVLDNAIIDTNIFENYSGCGKFPASKFATSDILIHSIVDITMIYSCIVTFQHLITHSPIKVVDPIGVFNNCFIKNSDCQDYFIKSSNLNCEESIKCIIDEDIHDNITIYIRDVGQEGMYIENKSDHIVYINLVFPDTQCIFEIPGHFSGELFPINNEKTHSPFLLAEDIIKEKAAKYMVKLIKYI